MLTANFPDKPSEERTSIEPFLIKAITRFIRMMNSNFYSICLNLFKIVILILFLSPFLEKAHALDELFETYQSPQGVAMGNALTADAQGYHANYYNPAGLAKIGKARPEIVVIDWEWFGSLGGMTSILSTKSMGIYRLFGVVRENPGRYTYFKLASVPGFTMRGFSISMLGAYEYAATATGNNIDINAHLDVGPTVGFARNFASNLIKLGVSATWLLRHQLKGVYDQSDFAGGDTAVAAKMKEGHGPSINVGAILTLPNKYLPTLGVVWKDALDTRFISSHFLNKDAAGAPDPIKQSVNVAFSVHPILAKGLKSTIALEYKHIERPDLVWRKKAHLGLQLEDERTFYVWAGLNQLYITAGFALRVKGGTLEVGSYGVDVGEGTLSKEDRRFFLRYTVSF